MSIKNQIVDYEKNKKNIEHWLLLKGEYRYKNIIKFLKEKNIECNWDNITSCIKYDKRILINSFKYIVFLEELFKSFINKYGNEKLENLLAYSFKESLVNFLKLKGCNEYDEINLQILENEKKSLNEFRNSVVHNKILLNKKFNGKNLNEIINIFSKVLPLSYRKGFINDINNCSKNLMENLLCIRITII